MDDLLEHLSRLEFGPQSAGDPRAALHHMLALAFAADLHYLGAYRAWREAALSDHSLARKQRDIQAWTTARFTAVFQFLKGLPGARADVDIPSLARAMDSFFWNLLAQAVNMRRPELNSWIDAATHLIFHALFTDPPPRPAAESAP